MERDLALFLMLAQTAEKLAGTHPHAVPQESLRLSDEIELAQTMPVEVRQAVMAAEVYKLFFVFETYLRDLILSVLSEADKENWWSKVPPDVQQDVESSENDEQVKSWMALGARDKLSLTTLPQLIKIIDHQPLWKEHFSEVLRDRALVQEARHIVHLRNVICHMNTIPEDEIARVKQVMRDWFRVVAP